MINVTVEKLLEDFDEIIGLCEENDEIITILKDGEPDLVLMSCNTYEKQKALLNMKERLLEIEEEQIKDSKTYAIEDLNQLK